MEVDGEGEIGALGQKAIDMKACPPWVTIGCQKFQVAEFAAAASA